jgi:hypothetical protein
LAKEVHEFVHFILPLKAYSFSFAFMSYLIASDQHSNQEPSILLSER